MKFSPDSQSFSTASVFRMTDFRNKLDDIEIFALRDYLAQKALSIKVSLNVKQRLDVSLELVFKRLYAILTSENTLDLNYREVISKINGMCDADWIDFDIAVTKTLEMLSQNSELQRVILRNLGIGVPDLNVFCEHVTTNVLQFCEQNRMAYSQVVMKVLVDLSLNQKVNNNFDTRIFIDGLINDSLNSILQKPTDNIPEEVRKKTHAVIIHVSEAKKPVVLDEPKSESELFRALLQEDEVAPAEQIKSEFKLFNEIIDVLEVPPTDPIPEVEPEADDVFAGNQLAQRYFDEQIELARKTVQPIFQHNFQRAVNRALEHMVANRESITELHQVDHFIHKIKRSL